MPRRIIAADYISLDGVVEDPVGIEGSGLGNWTGPFARGPQGDQFKSDELAAADTLLFGRRTYDAFAAVWPTLSDPFAQRINAMPKVVVSTTLAAGGWANSTVLNGDLAATIGALKGQPGGDILVYGSVALVHALAALGLVDGYNLMIYPTVLGRGKRLFAEGVASRQKLVDCRELGSGIVLVRYETEPAA